MIWIYKQNSLSLGAPNELMKIWEQQYAYIIFLGRYTKWAYISVMANSKKTPYNMIRLEKFGKLDYDRLINLID